MDVSCRLWEQLAVAALVCQYLHSKGNLRVLSSHTTVCHACMAAYGSDCSQQVLCSASWLPVCLLCPAGTQEHVAALEQRLAAAEAKLA
jgi:hypothetical protein